MTRSGSKLLLVGVAWALLASCGGGDGKPVGFDGPSMQPASRAGQQSLAAAPMAAAPAIGPATTQALRVQPPTPAVAPVAGSLAPARFNPGSVDAAQIAASLRDFANAAVDESSCTRGGIACDEIYSARLNQKLRGSVGRLVNEDRQVSVDTEDLVLLPAVPAPVTFFIQSSAASKDVLHVTLEDRRGTPLYRLPGLPPGASTAFGWTRTNEAGAAPLHLRLRAPAGPGDHAMEYLVLPVADAEWRNRLVSARPTPKPAAGH